MGTFASPVSLAVGLGAGLASALLFAALAGGTTLALPLFLLSALPVIIATLGWGPVAGLAAVIVAALSLAIGLTPAVGGLHAAVTTVPTFVASYLLGLARVADEPGRSGVTVWFPVGTAMTALAGLIATGTVIAGVIVDFGNETQVRDSVRVVQAMLAAQGMQASEAEAQAMAARLIGLQPFVVPMGLTVVALFNLWLGARVVQKSERLPRPWEPCPDLVLPRAAILVLTAAFVVLFIAGGSVFGMVAAAYAGAFVALFMALGMAAVHALTRQAPARPFLLMILWGIVLATALPALAFGLAEHLFRFRARRSSRPPATTA